MTVSLFKPLDPATCRHLYLRLDVEARVVGMGMAAGAGYVCVSCGTRFVVKAE
jgi:hypothetical protein